MLAPYVAQMRRRLAEAMGIDPGAVNVKATTMEGLGAIGRHEGIAAQAVATLIGNREQRTGNSQ
jgi:2-C-methyl-D-erythritol 2,4-cyclodiphosphate synthase